MGFLRWFNKSTRTVPKRHPDSFYGVIATIEPLEVNQSSFLSASTIYSVIYPNMDFLFFDMSTIREFIAGRLTDKGGFPRLYLYGVTIHPEYIVDENRFKVACENSRLHIGFDEFDKTSVDIVVIEDMTRPNSIRRIRPGIETIDEFYRTLSLGYKDTLEHTIKPKYFKRFSEFKDADTKLLDKALSELRLETIIDIFDSCCYKSDEWEYKFKKELIDAMIQKNMK